LGFPPRWHVAGARTPSSGVAVGHRDPRYRHPAL